MIRPAVVSDIPRLLEMGAKFAEKAKLAEHVGYDPASMEATFAMMAEGENFCLLMGETGAIGGVKSVHPFNHSHLIAQELFWWSEGREGLRLLDAFEEWAADCGTIRMFTLEAVSPARVACLYERRGYMPLEHGFIKRVHT